MVMINLPYGRACNRIIAIGVALVFLTAVLLFSTGTDSAALLRSSRLWIGANASNHQSASAEPANAEPTPAAPASAEPSNAPSDPNKKISYDLTTPPSTGCEALVNDLQQQLIRTYSKLLKGVRYANIWGYLETENKGDAAIWTAQQMLLTTLGIDTMDACRYAYTFILLHPSFT